MKKSTFLTVHTRWWLLTRLLHGQAGRSLDAACRIGAHALKYAGVNVQQSVYPEVVPGRMIGGHHHTSCFWLNFGQTNKARGFFFFFRAKQRDFFITLFASRFLRACLTLRGLLIFTRRARLKKKSLSV